MVELSIGGRRRGVSWVRDYHTKSHLLQSLQMHLCYEKIFISAYT